MTSLMDLTNPLGLSPYFVVDAGMAFMISRVEKGRIYIRGPGELGSTAILMKAGEGFVAGDRNKLRQYIREYLPSDPLVESESFEQILTFGENRVDPVLWEKLNPGGFYQLGVKAGPIDLSGFKFEAFGKLWPWGQATEFGWRFDDETPGLTGFEFARIKKLV